MDFIIIPNCSWILARSSLADCPLEEVLDQQNLHPTVIQRAENPLRRNAIRRNRTRESDSHSWLRYGPVTC